MTPNEFFATLEAHDCSPRGDGSRGFVSRCPAHDDANASLSVSAGDDGRTLVHCFAGCETADVVSALGLTLADLYEGEKLPEPPTRRPQRPAEPLPTSEQVQAWADRLQGHTKLLERLKALKGWTPGALAALGVGFDGERLTIPVRDGAGALVNVSRYLPGDRPSGASKMLAVRGRPRDLFPAPESLPDGPVWVVEGEPDAISLASIELPVMAIPGAQGWRSGMAERLRGREVIVCCDCDKPGRELAEKVRASLNGVAASVRVVDLDPDRSNGYDVGDLVAESTEARGHLLGKLMTTVPPPAAETARTRISLQWASDVTPERIEWLWTDRLPLHDLAVLAGEPGLGKSTTTAELAARITRGELAGALDGKPHSILIATAEDHFESVVWGRLTAAGADLRQVANVVVSDGLLAIPEDVDALAATCRRLREQGRPVALIVVDPISAYLGGVDSHKDAAVRGALAPLAKLAQSENVCVLAVAHLNKGSAGQLLSRISGSGAFGAAPRSVLAFARDPDDEEGEQGCKRVIVHAKSNHGQYAPTLAIHIEATMVEEVGATVSKLVVDGETDLGPEDLRPGIGAGQPSGEDIRDALIVALTSGERASSEVKSEVAAHCGVSTKTVERRAVQMITDREIHRSEAGFPKRSYWCLFQWGHASGDEGVPTGSVPTADPPSLQAIPSVASVSGDVHNATSPLGDLAPLTGETYDEWEARLENAHHDTERIS